MGEHRRAAPTPLAAELRLQQFRADIATRAARRGGHGTIHEVLDETESMVGYVVSALEAEHYNYPTESEINSLLLGVRGAWSTLLTVDASDSEATAATYRLLLDEIIEAAIPILETRDMLPKDISR